jgi:hypothetical protein
VAVRGGAVRARDREDSDADAGRRIQDESGRLGARADAQLAEGGGEVALDRALGQVSFSMFS